MTAHTHTEMVEGCYRCDLNRDEIGFPVSAGTSEGRLADEELAETCVFCRKIKNGGDEHGRVYSLRDEATVRFEPLNPVTEGHMLFVPREHVADASEHPSMAGIVFAHAAAHGLLMGEPFNLITSVGAEATQTVRHLHVHYVPRRADDGLPLPWSAAVRGQGAALRLQDERAYHGECHCDRNPATTNGPEEDCPEHGRPYSYWVEGCNELGAKLAAAGEALQRVRALCDEVMQYRDGAETVLEIGEVIAALDGPVR